MKVTVEILTGPLFNIEVGDDATIADLKKEIAAQQELPSDRLILTLDSGNKSGPHEVGSKEPVLEIKRNIEQNLGVPMSSQILSVSGWEFVDELDMEDYPIVTEGTKPTR
ncbi:hypothetical protein Dsin_031631 [Dipteronia sinensis]|uniref:Ubiquitin-like domain-containing protein n=1 Tax=Dipteronia sinensis TaxID=43782 RepID=A0AAD9ZLX7_9ROSI|nr:hypothetical protein Dsin_031631 [Dipteronia sinensis]